MIQKCKDTYQMDGEQWHLKDSPRNYIKNGGTWDMDNASWQQQEIQ